MHIPVGYHGRSSTIIPSDTPIKDLAVRVSLKVLPEPVFGPSKMVDFELEMAFITTDANKMGQAIPVDEAEDYIFGLVLFNDWSARDIQKWEYVPLGPFLAKNFASSISAWIVTLDALEPFRVESPDQEPEPLPYLRQSGKKSYDIQLEVDLITQDGSSTTLAKSNFKYMYWTMAQQLAHHTVNGCKVNSGDMMGSGTISGQAQRTPTDPCWNLAWQGTKPLELEPMAKRSIIDPGPRYSSS